MGVTAGSAAYLWLPAPGNTYYSCLDYVDYWGSESHPDCTRLIPLVASLYLLFSPAAVIKPNPPPTFRCPSRTRPRRSLPLLSPYTTTFPLCESFLALVSLYNFSSVFKRTFCQTTPSTPVRPMLLPLHSQTILNQSCLGNNVSSLVDWPATSVPWILWDSGTT